MSNPATDIEQILRAALPGLGPELGLGCAEPGPAPPLVASLTKLIRLLHKWNQAYNLTSVREPADMAVRHVLDSLTARPFLTGRVLDVGCGAGFPGLPLALAEPGRSFTLIDASLKKVRFVRQAVAELAIRNVAVEQVRIEDFMPAEPYDTLICRAFGSLAAFVLPGQRLLAPGGRLVALKGKVPDDEIAALQPDWMAAVHPVRVPELDAQRHIVVLTRSGPRT